MLRSRWAKVAVFLLCLVPFGRLAWRAWNGDLTPNPIEYITHFTGDWAIRLVVATLAVTPLRKLLHLPDLIRFRRMIGLFAFFYASLHFATWFGLDKFFDMHEILKDFTKRPFIIAGLTAFLSMTPLAAVLRIAGGDSAGVPGGKLVADAADAGGGKDCGGGGVLSAIGARGCQDRFRIAIRRSTVWLTFASDTCPAR